MRRLPTLLAAAALCVGVLTTITPSQAQGPGGRGGRGGPGGGFGFGFGGPGGMFGGGGSGIDMNLLRNEAVQKEIKLTDKQKTQLEDLRTSERNKRQQIFEAMRANNGGGNGFGGPGGGNNGGNNGGGRRGQNNNGAPGGGGPGGGGPGFGGPGGPGGGGPGGFFRGMDPAVMEQMQALSNDTQSVLKKILNPAQVKRVQEISLQRQDVFAVARPDIAQKLNLNDEDLLQVQEITQQMNGELGSTMQQGWTTMQKLFTDANGKRLSRDERQKKMEEPEVKAQLEKSRAQQDEQRQAIRNRAKSQIAKVLSKKQKAAFNKMLGEPFDLSLLDTGRGGPGGRNGGPPSNAGTTNNNTASSTKAAPAAATPKTASTAPAEPASKKKRSLGSRRDD